MQEFLSTTTSMSDISDCSIFSANFLRDGAPLSAGWQVVRQSSLSGTRCASLLWTTRRRGFSLLLSLFSFLLPFPFPSPLAHQLLPALARSSCYLCILLTCMMLCNGRMEVADDGWRHSLWYQRGQGPAQLDVRRANAHLAQGIGETFYLFRLVRISFRIFILVFALSQEGRKPVQMLHRSISQTTGVPCVHLLLPSCCMATMWRCQVFWKAVAQRSEDFECIYRMPVTSLLE